jgi:hypothetical protein
MRHQQPKYHKLKATLCLGTSLFLSACETRDQSKGLGGAVGASLGGIAGGLSNPGKDGEYRTRNIILGSALGGMGGLMAGGMIHGETQQQKAEAYGEGKKASQTLDKGGAPSLKEPKVEARWVESRVQGNRYIEGHFEYIITEQAQWEAQ